MEAKQKILFIDDELHLKSFAEFERMRRETHFCDIILNFGTYSVSAHKVVLAAAIPYLVEILQNARQDGERKEIAIEDIESSVVEGLIDYAYTGKIEITTENVESLLYGTCVLHVSRVKDACCEFLSDQMNCENVLEIRQFAYNLECQDLVEKSDNYICENFEVVSKTEKFLKLPFYVVKLLIKRDDLKVTSEDDVLRAVLNWAKTSPIERENYLRNLLGDIRIIYLTQKYYDEVIASEIVVSQVFSLNMAVQLGALSLSESEKLRLYPEIRSRTARKSTAEYTQAVYILFSPIFLYALVTTQCFLWFIGCFITLALDNHFRLVVKLAAISPDRNLVKYIIILFMVILLFKSPLKCLVILLTKVIADCFFKKNELHAKI